MGDCTTTRPAWYCASEESLALTRPADVAVVRVRAREFARKVGLDLHEQWSVAIAASEAASNAITFGAPGWLVMRAVHAPDAETDAAGRARIEIRRVGVEIDVVDSGPRLDHPDRPLGHGVAAIRRLMDEVSLGRASSGGARLLARKWSGREARRTDAP